MVRLFRPAENGPYALTVTRSDGPGVEVLDRGVGEFVTHDVDSGDYDDPRIKNFRSPTSGTYTVHVTGVAPADLGAFRVDVIRR